MDPRPFHFDYRKPRPSNPTYQSGNLYDSIYQFTNETMRNQKVFPSQNPEVSRYRNSVDLRKGSISQKPSSEPDTMYASIISRIKNQSSDMIRNNKLEPHRNSMSHSKPVLPSNKEVNSKLSNYGYNVMRDQRDIFEKQQTGFDIINYHPSKNKARLKAYPKLTLEDRINQRMSFSPLKEGLKRISNPITSRI